MTVVDPQTQLDGIDMSLVVCRRLYWAAVEAGHDGEAEHYEQRVDSLLAQRLELQQPGR